jgi:hypothetical protein
MISLTKNLREYVKALLHEEQESAAQKQANFCKEQYRLRTQQMLKAAGITEKQLKKLGLRFRVDGYDNEGKKISALAEKRFPIPFEAYHYNQAIPPKLLKILVEFELSDEEDGKKLLEKILNTISSACKQEKTE